MLIGRGAQLRRLTAMLEAIRTEGSALVVRGEAGIGKSAILDAARETAGGLGLRVLHTAGVPGESDMPLAGLHRLLRPLGTGLASLDARHRSLLQHAFGLGELRGEALMQVALATLELLSSAAGQRPLVLIADDVHQLDRESREVIAFVARRAGPDPIVVLGAAREGYEQDLGIAALALPRLSDRDATDLLDACAPGLDAGTRVLLLAEAAGNPLGLVELPSTRTLGALHQGVSGPLPVTKRLEEAFGRRGRSLPGSTAVLLLLCAAEAAASTSEILAAGASLTGRPMTLADLEPAVDAALLRVDENGLRFRHPLMRSATYQAAGLQARHAAHTALVKVVATDQDRVIWHRAASTIGPDASIAQLMEDRARRADGRGAALQAATSLGRAAELTAEDRTRGERLLHAAELAFEVGRADLVSAFVDRTSTITLDAVGRARADTLRPFSVDDPSGERTRVGSLVTLAEAATAHGDTDVALDLLLGASVRTWWADPGPELRERLTTAAEATAVDRWDARLLTTLAVAAPITHGATVSERLPQAMTATTTSARDAHLLGLAAHAVADFAVSHQIFRTAAGKLRSDGRFGLLTHVETARSWSSLLLGEWEAAGTAAAEGLRLGRLTGQPLYSGLALATLAALAGARGDEDRAHELATEAESVLRPARVSVGLARVQIARGLTELSAGRYEEARTQLTRCFDPQDPAHHDTEQFGAVGFFADAAALTGRQAEAREVVDRLRAVVGSARLTVVMAGLDHARPLVATDEDAEAAFLHALRDVVAPSPFDRARCNLFYGMWLRRRRRVVESRGPLRAAREAFDRLDAPAWGARTRQELRAAGDADILRSRAMWADLSSQELQIAQMAAAGLSNRDIGSRLYLSHRTVGSHLYRIFPKLGITSRGQLNGVLPGRSEAVDPGSPPSFPAASPPPATPRM